MQPAETPELFFRSVIFADRTIIFVPLIEIMAASLRYVGVLDAGWYYWYDLAISIANFLPDL